MDWFSFAWVWQWSLTLQLKLTFTSALLACSTQTSSFSFLSPSHLWLQRTMKKANETNTYTHTLLTDLNVYWPGSSYVRRWFAHSMKLWCFYIPNYNMNIYRSVKREEKGWNGWMAERKTWLKRQKEKLQQRRTPALKVKKKRGESEKLGRERETASELYFTSIGFAFSFFTLLISLMSKVFKTETQKIKCRNQ